jgi:hypothetical protein
MNQEKHDYMNKIVPTLNLLGVDIYESNGQYKKFSDILFDLNQKWQNMSLENKENLTQQLFNS